MSDVAHMFEPRGEDMALTRYTMELPGVISGMRMLRVGDARDVPSAT